MVKFVDPSPAADALDWYRPLGSALDHPFARRFSLSFAYSHNNVFSALQVASNLAVSEFSPMKNILQLTINFSKIPT